VPVILAMVTLVIFMAGQLSRLSLDQAAAVQGQVARFSSPVVLTVTGSLAAIVCFGSVIAGGDVKFRQLFATALWLVIPFAF
jgi:hypothetical protein